MLQQVEDITKGLPESSGNAENHCSGSRTAACESQDPQDCKGHVEGRGSVWSATQGGCCLVLGSASA